MTLGQPSGDRQLSFGNRISSWTPEAFAGYQSTDNPLEMRVSVNVDEKVKSNPHRALALPTPELTPTHRKDRARLEIKYLQSHPSISFDYVGSSASSDRLSLPHSANSSLRSSTTTTPHRGPLPAASHGFPPSLSLPSLMESLGTISEANEDSDSDAETEAVLPREGSRSAGTTPSNKFLRDRKRTRSPVSPARRSIGEQHDQVFAWASRSKSMSASFSNPGSRRLSASELALPASFSLTERCTDNATIP